MQPDKYYDQIRFESQNILPLMESRKYDGGHSHYVLYHSCLSHFYVIMTHSGIVLLFRPSLLCTAPFHDELDTEPPLQIWAITNGIVLRPFSEELRRRRMCWSFSV